MVLNNQNHIFPTLTGFSPGNILGILLGEYLDDLAADVELAVLRGAHADVGSPVVPGVGGVVLEHVDHVVEGDEGVVDGDDLDTLIEGGAEDEATDAAEAVDAQLGRGGAGRGLRKRAKDNCQRRNEEAT